MHAIVNQFDTHIGKMDDIADVEFIAKLWKEKTGGENEQWELKAGRDVGKRETTHYY